MAQFTIAEVLQAVGGRIAAPTLAEEIVFGGVSTDTRAIKRGDVFVALSGERFDGHDFAAGAIEKGAAGLIVSRELPELAAGTVQILVEDTLAALQALARFHRCRFTIPVIAITGSNGKTSTKDLTAAVLSGCYHVLKTEANYNNEIGLPLTLLKLTPAHQAAVVEMGMRARGEIRELAQIALPTMGIVTNVGETHMELLGSLENIAAAKAELVENITESGVVILNADNAYVAGMAHKAKGKVVSYGLAAADVFADNIVVEAKGTSFDCHCRQGTFAAFIPVLGRHNVYNALAAVAAGLELGLSTGQIAAGLATSAISGMRLSVQKMGSYTVINDAYNASPLSMAAAIDTLTAMGRERKIAVLGDMLELGHVAVAAHRQVGKQLAECGVAAVVTVGELAAQIADAAKEYGIAAAVCCHDHEQAKAELARLLLPGDTILIKGSRGMKMETVLSMFS